MGGWNSYSLRFLHQVRDAQMVCEPISMSRSRFHLFYG